MVFNALKYFSEFKTTENVSRKSATNIHWEISVCLEKTITNRLTHTVLHGRRVRVRKKVLLTTLKRELEVTFVQERRYFWLLFDPKFVSPTCKAQRGLNNGVRLLFIEQSCQFMSNQFIVNAVTHLWNDAKMHLVYKNLKKRSIVWRNQGCKKNLKCVQKITFFFARSIHTNCFN